MESSPAAPAGAQERHAPAATADAAASSAAVPVKKEEGTPARPRASAAPPKSKADKKAKAASATTPSKAPTTTTPKAPLPVRPEAENCPYFMKTKKCRYGASCKFNHPVDLTLPPREAVAAATSSTPASSKSKRSAPQAKEPSTSQDPPKKTSEKKVANNAPSTPNVTGALTSPSNPVKSTPKAKTMAKPDASTPIPPSSASSRASKSASEMPTPSAIMKREHAPAASNPSTPQSRVEPTHVAKLTPMSRGPPATPPSASFSAHRSSKFPAHIYAALAELGQHIARCKEDENLIVGVDLASSLEHRMLQLVEQRAKFSGDRYEDDAMDIKLSGLLHDWCEFLLPIFENSASVQANAPRAWDDVTDTELCVMKLPMHVLRMNELWEEILLSKQSHYRIESLDPKLIKACQRCFSKRPQIKVGASHDIDEELLAKYVRPELPTQRDEDLRQQALTSIRRVATDFWSDREVRVLPFGSSVSGLHFAGSDLDVAVLAEDGADEDWLPFVREAETKTVFEPEEASSHDASIRRFESLAADREQEDEEDSHEDPREQSPLAKYKPEGLSCLFLAQELRKHPDLFENVETIVMARVPIIKCVHAPTQLHCDIAFGNPLGVENSKLVEAYVGRDPELISPFILAVKLWAKRKHLADASNGQLSSYAWVLLAIHFLQHIRDDLGGPLLPFLQADKNPVVNHTIAGCKVKYGECPGFQPRTTLRTPWSLLTQFFLYFGQRAEELISGPYVLGIRKQKMDKKMNEPLWRLALEDPFELTHDLGTKLGGTLAVTRLKIALMEAAELVGKGDAASMQALFTPSLLEWPVTEAGSRCCWVCAKKDHMARSCVFAEAPKCFICGLSGHIRRDCPVVLRRKSSGSAKRR